MTSLALALVLASAVVHALWNYFSKRIGGGGVSFIWLFATLNGLIYAPLGIAVILIQQPPLGLPQFGFMAVSACIHLVYFTLLGRGYKTGDLSLVYPLARGTGPMLSTIAAIVLLGERPTPIAVIGAALIGVGVFILTGDPRKFRQSGSGQAIVYALLTGLTIATYTIWDSRAVTVMMIPPLVFDWISNSFRALFLTPYAIRHWDEIKVHWREHRTEAFAVATLSPLSYILVLTALTFSPVSYIAPAREISILIGAFLGARLLSEGDTMRRLAAASAMMIGVAALALG
jgi:drug/metabolite transporter (DMT)-like permease